MMLLSGKIATTPIFVRVYGYSFWFLCVVLLLALHAGHGLDSDEGVILNGAWNLLNGRTLYTDFFEFIAPGSFYLIFAIWKVFGAHFWIAKLLGILAILGAVVGVYCTGRLILSQEQTIVPRWALFFGPLVYCLMSGYWPAIKVPVTSMPSDPVDNIVACEDPSRVTSCIRYVRVCIRQSAGRCDIPDPVNYVPMIGLFVPNPINPLTDMQRINLGVPIPGSTVTMPAESLGFTITP